MRWLQVGHEVALSFILILAKMYCLKYHVNKMNDMICIIMPKYRYNRYIAI